MSIKSVCHWITPVKGYQLSLEYNPGTGYYLSNFPAQKDSPVSPFISLNLMFGSRQTLLECSRKSTKRENEAIVLFDRKVEEFISSHPVEETDVVEVAPGDRFVYRDSTILVLMPASGSNYHCKHDGEDRVFSYSKLVELERTDPLPQEELQPIVDDLISQWEEEKRQKEEAKRQKEEAIEKGKAIVPAWANALLVAELTENHSDPMTDYYHPHVVVESYPLCFSRSERNNSQEMKIAAKLMDETAHLTDGEYENRDRALRAKDNYGSGWQIRKLVLSSRYESDYAYKLLGEKEMPESHESPQSQEEVSLHGAIVRRNEEHNGIEVVFDSKPNPETIGSIKSLGFRWSPRQKLWYSKYSESKMNSLNALLA